MCKMSIQPLARAIQMKSMLGLQLHSCAHQRVRLRFVPRIARQYTTQKSLRGTSASNRKHITVMNDDGHVEWGELSNKEKAARTTQQSFNLMVILAGVVMTVWLFIPVVLCFHAND